MFAIAFNLIAAQTAENHPKGVAQAYADIGSTRPDPVRDFRAFKVEHGSDFTGIVKS